MKHNGLLFLAGFKPWGAGTYFLPSTSASLAIQIRAAQDHEYWNDRPFTYTQLRKLVPPDIPIYYCGPTPKEKNGRIYVYLSQQRKRRTAIRYVGTTTHCHSF